jgi:hypothetical protein
MKYFLRTLSLALVFLGFHFSANSESPQASSQGVVEIHRNSGNVVRENKDQYLSYYFGRVVLNSRPTVTYSLSNDSDSPLAVKRISISGMGFDQVNNCPDVLPARKNCLTRIAFWPHFVGIYTGRLVWEMGDGNIILNLWGDGVEM